MKRCRYADLTALVGKVVISSASSYKHEIETQVDCQTSNVVYCLTCSKCTKQYFGGTEKTLAIRFGQHRGYVRNKELQKATGAEIFISSWG